MQYRKGIVISTGILFIIAIYFVLPVYAEVKSLKTDKSFYTKGSTIIFSGIVDKNDVHKQVNLVIHDPQNNFVGISGGFSDDDNQFKIMVKTTDPQFHDRFSLKGIYNATAFITVEKNGTVVSFDFSPDGSPIVPQTTNPEPQPKTEPTEEPKPKQDATGQVQSETTQQTSDGGKSVQERIRERIEMAKKQQESLSKPSVQEKPTQSTTVEQTTNEKVVNETLSTPVAKTEEKVPAKELNPVQFDLGSYSVYTISGIVIAGVIMAVVYSLKNKNKNKTKDKPEQKQREKAETQSTITPSEGEYPLMILKNRLANGEITIEEYNEIKNALKEP